MNNVEKDVVRELKKEFGKDFKTKIFFKLFKEKILKIYRKGMVDNFNYFNKY